MTLVVGVDVGGTKAEAILFNGKNIVKSARVPREADKPYAVALGQVVAAINAVRVKGIKAVGLATPGYVKNGVLYGSPNNPSLIARKLAADVSKRVRLPVVHENDAKLFGLAEARLGAGKGKRNVIGLIVGTGVGAGIVVDNSIMRGAIGAAGEIGHAPYLDKDYEHYTSGPALERMYSECFGKKARAADILLEMNDRHVIELQDIYYDHLGRLCATLINAFNPEVIVLGGGVSKSIDYSLLSEATRQYALPALFKEVSIVRHKISDSAGSIGAALLALESLKK